MSGDSVGSVFTISGSGNVAAGVDVQITYWVKYDASSVMASDRVYGAAVAYSGTILNECGNIGVASSAVFSGVDSVLS